MTLADVHETIKFPAKRVHWGLGVCTCVYVSVRIRRQGETYNERRGGGAKTQNETKEDFEPCEQISFK